MAKNPFSGLLERVYYVRLDNLSVECTQCKQINYFPEKFEKEGRNTCCTLCNAELVKENKINSGPQ